MSDASPQVEHGYTRIANELLDAVLQFGFSKRQMAVMLGIIRKTYGFNKTEDDMTVTQLAQVSGLARQNASTALAELESMSAVSKRDGAYGYVLKINKNYQNWGASKQDASNRCASKRDGSRIETRRSTSQNETVDVSKRCTQKTTPKDNSKRQSQKTGEVTRPTGLPDSVTDQLWSDFLDHRKQIKRPMTERAVSMLVSKLVEIEADGANAGGAVRESIINGWRGVFPPKDHGKPKGVAHSGFNERTYSSHIPDWARDVAESEQS